MIFGNFQGFFLENDPTQPVKLFRDASTEKVKREGEKNKVREN